MGRTTTKTRSDAHSIANVPSRGNIGTELPPPPPPLSAGSVRYACVVVYSGARARASDSTRGNVHGAGIARLERIRLLARTDQLIANVAVRIKRSLFAFHQSFRASRVLVVRNQSNLLKFVDGNSSFLE